MSPAYASVLAAGDDAKAKAKVTNPQCLELPQLYLSISTTLLIITLFACSLLSTLSFACCLHPSAHQLHLDSTKAIVVPCCTNREFLLQQLPTKVPSTCTGHL